ncbi:MAG: hypothetical protein AAF960_23375 [Bacteroidota bacterium]
MTTQIKISNCQFNITDNNGTFSIERIKENGAKQYKRTFATMEKAVTYCKRMSYISDLYQEVRTLVKHFSQAACAWMWKSAKRMVKEAREIVQFNSKLKCITD